MSANLDWEFSPFEAFGGHGNTSKPPTGHTASDVKLGEGSKPKPLPKGALNTGWAGKPGKPPVVPRWIGAI